MVRSLNISRQRPRTGFRRLCSTSPSFPPLRRLSRRSSLLPVVAVVVVAPPATTTPTICCSSSKLIIRPQLPLCPPSSTSALRTTGVIRLRPRLYRFSRLRHPACSTLHRPSRPSRDMRRLGSTGRPRRPSSSNRSRRWRRRSCAVGAKLGGITATTGRRNPRGQCLLVFFVVV